MTQPLDSNTPQFGTVEYAGSATGDACKFCGQAVADRYYRVNGQMACASCADRAQRDLPRDNRAAYMRALLYGIGASIVGMIAYATFGIVTGLVIGYLSLAVGWFIGKAMMKGSGGLGGRRYQITAVLLTYAAVSMAAIPMAIAHEVKQKPHAVNQQQQQKPASGADAQAAPAGEKPQAPKVGLAKALGLLALIGLASPFLELADPLHGLIGLVILFVGLNIAWRTAAGTALAEVSGPYENAPKASEAGAS